jgi:hypothetical protein
MVVCQFTIVSLMFCCVIPCAWNHQTSQFCKIWNSSTESGIYAGVPLLQNLSKIWQYIWQQMKLNCGSLLNPDLPLPWKDMAYWHWLDPVNCHVICIEGKLLFNPLTVEWCVLEVGWTGGGTCARQLNCVLHSTNRVWVLEIQLLYNNFLGYGAINSTFSVDWQLPELIYCVGWWLAMGDACFWSKCWSWSVLLHVF